MNSIADLIEKKACQLGYENCGIIPVQALEGYAEKMEEYRPYILAACASKNEKVRDMAQWIAANLAFIQS